MNSKLEACYEVLGFYCLIIDLRHEQKEEANSIDESNLFVEERTERTTERTDKTVQTQT